MPELPEVETTVRGLKKTILGLIIKDVWTDLATKDSRQHDTVANPKYFKLFNNKDKFVHIIFTLSGKNYLAFSDMRKFGKITLLDTKTAHETRHLKNIGPEPLDKNFTAKKLEERLKRKPSEKIKTVLMDQSIVAGIGNIYSDEILWQAGVHPERKVLTLLRRGSKGQEIKLIFKAMQKILTKSIKAGGDSMSDYRNLSGGKGKFQFYHKAYRQTGEKCRKRNCGGTIQRKMINNRSAHFCSVHQK